MSSPGAKLDLHADVRLEESNRFTGALPRTEKVLARVPEGLQAALSASAPDNITDPLDRLLVAAAPALQVACERWYAAATKTQRRDRALLSVMQKRKRRTLDARLERHLAAVVLQQAPPRVGVALQIPEDEVTVLRTAGRKTGFSVEVAADLGGALDLLARYWRGVVYLSDGPLLRHPRFDVLVGAAGYVVARGSWRGSADPGWGVVPVVGPSDAVTEVEKALELARMRWEKGALGLR